MTARHESFARLHRPGQPLLLPNAWDYVTAAALTQAGFAAIGTTSLGVAAAAGLLAAAGAARVSTGSLLIREALKCIVDTANAALHTSVPPDPARPTYHQVQALLPTTPPATPSSA
jgi:2-methylisocitrate lyase-like PEP mutase family enzyme